MSKIAHYLQEHLVGEVMTGADARRYFATDNSIFQVPPAVVVYPRGENDVRKTSRFTWQLAERGRVIPLTARGSGTDLGGGAIGSGIMLVFPAHMNRILELDSKTGAVTVEAGINYGKLQQTLKTHGRWLPPYPASYEYSTVGGAVANNASGINSFKYGDTRTYVSGLRVVLANGEVIETARLTKRDLNRKLGLSTFEGEIYRAIDALLEENHETVDKTLLGISKNTAGYNLADIKRRDGSFDLTPLFVGSQGTLGIVTEIMLDTEAFNPQTTLIMAAFDSVHDAVAAIDDLKDTDEMPSALEMVNGGLLDLVYGVNPNQTKELMEPPFPAVTLFIEYDTAERGHKKAVKKAQRILEQRAASQLVETDPEKQERLWKLRQLSSGALAFAQGPARGVPVVDDGVVPPEKLQAYLQGIHDLLQKEKLPPAIWGHAGDANLHLQPVLNLGLVGDRQTAFRIMDEYYHLVMSLGGSTSGENNDGRLRAPYLESVYGPEVYALFTKIKQICDPYGTLNPGVKIGVSFDDIKPLVRQDYSLDHLYDHLPWG